MLNWTVFVNILYMYNLMESSFLLDTTYIPETEICCGKYAFVKIGKDGKVTKCCGVFPYVPSDNTQICCSNRLHEWKSGNYSVFILSAWILLYSISLFSQNLVYNNYIKKLFVLSLYFIFSIMNVIFEECQLVI